MTVKDRLQDSLIRYPHTNHNKIAVYMQWFLCGTYIWKNGELGERGSRIKKPMTQEEGYVTLLKDTIRKLKTEDPLYKMLFVTHQVLNSAIKNVLKAGWEAEQPLQLAKDQNVRWISSDCALLSIPKNITPDWQVAVDEMKTWLLDNYNLFESNDKKLIDKITQQT